jgi:tetratricopeptide (TPR) repeat protein
MEKKSYAALFVLAAAIIVLISCSTPSLENQLKFGIWASQKDLWDEAIFRWKKVLSQDPNSLAAHNNLGVAYEKKGLWADARKEYELALKLAPKNAQVKYNYDRLKENLQSSSPGKEKKDEKEKK